MAHSERNLGCVLVTAVSPDMITNSKFEPQNLRRTSNLGLFEANFRSEIRLESSQMAFEGFFGF